MINKSVNYLRVAGLVLGTVLFSGILFFLMPAISDSPMVGVIVVVLGFLSTLFVAKPEACFGILFLSRSSLEPLLEQSKINVAGYDVGLGLVLNLIIIIMALSFCIVRPATLKKIPLKASWLLFIIYIGVTILYAPEKKAAVRLFENILSYFAVFSMPFFLVKTKRDKEFWFMILLCSFILPVLITNMGFFGLVNMMFAGGSRFAGPFTHPNILAFYLVLGLAVVMCAFKSQYFSIGKRHEIFLGIFAMSMVAGLLATGTRNAWIAAWVMFFSYGIMQDRKFIVIPLLIIPLFFFIPMVQDRVLDIFVNTNRTLDQGMNSWEWRMVTWKYSFQMIAQNPFFGYGLASFLPLSVQFFPSGISVGAHNVYLQVLFECGLIGLILFCGLLWGAMKSLYRIWQRSKDPGHAMVFFYMISYAMICFADNLLYYLVFNWYVWFFVGLVIRENQLRMDDLLDGQSRG